MAAVGNKVKHRGKLTKCLPRDKFGIEVNTSEPSESGAILAQITDIELVSAHLKYDENIIYLTTCVQCSCYPVSTQRTKRVRRVHSSLWDPISELVVVVMKSTSGSAYTGVGWQMP